MQLLFEIVSVIGLLINKIKLQLKLQAAMQQRVLALLPVPPFPCDLWSWISIPWNKK